MIEIRIIDAAHKMDIQLKNDSFPLWGNILPAFQNGQWSYSVLEWPENERTEMCFPDESYSYDEMAPNTTFIGAYDEGKCIGLAILEKHWTKHMHIPDLKVSKEYRSMGVGKALIQASMEEAKKQGYIGLYLECQDNNLSACLFYIRTGFRIGGLNTEIYKGTSQAGKSDILFYMD